MRIKVTAEDFRVEEQMDLPLDPHGGYTVYHVEKQGVTTPEVETLLARRLRRAPSAVRFPALKDRNAVAVQYVAVQGRGPAWVEGPGFFARRMGRAARPLHPADLRGNRFTIVVRDLTAEEASGLGGLLATLARDGLPNYFDQQRFGSRTATGDLPGRRILLRDAAGALHAHLAEPLEGDPPDVLAFKRTAAEHWGEWEVLFEAAPRPSNFRSVLTYLRDHPDDFRRALDLVTPRLLSLYVEAYQSLLWNRIVARYLLRQLGEPSATVEVAGERLPLFPAMAERLDAAAAIPLPSHRAVYEGDLADVAAEVLGEEGITLADLKPRLLRRAYLPKGNRPLLLLPEEVTAMAPAPDERFPGRQRVTVTFTLPPGSYATLVVRAIEHGRNTKGTRNAKEGRKGRERNERGAKDAKGTKGARNAKGTKGARNTKHAPRWEKESSSGAD